MEEPNEGKTYFMDFLEFVIGEFVQIISQYSNESIEQKLKVYELKNFLFSKMIEDLMVTIAKTCGTEELNELFQNELENVKLKDLSSLLKLMRQEKGLIDNVNSILDRDFEQEKRVLVKFKVVCWFIQKMGRIESVICPICEAPINFPYVLHPSPCPHTAHLECLSNLVQHPKDFNCPRCLPFISLSRYPIYK